MGAWASACTRACKQNSDCVLWAGDLDWCDDVASGLRPQAVAGGPLSPGEGRGPQRKGLQGPDAVGHRHSSQAAG
eukprot:5560823-Lingulodinium_polyedra.AAC.1